MSAPLSLTKDLAAQLARESGGGFWAGGGPREGKLGPWSTLLLDGRVFPGADSYDDPRAMALMDPEGELRYRIDSQKRKGGSGHKLVVEGYEPTEIKFTFRCWRPEQWAAFQAFLPIISPKAKTNKARRYRVAHPVLAVYGISEIFINKVHFPKQADHRMVRDITVEGIEVWDLGGKGKAKVVKQANINDTDTPVQAPFRFELVQSTDETIAQAARTAAADAARGYSREPTLTKVPLASQAFAFPLNLKR